ncbi:MAG: hypothetical protein ABR524_14205, partial [Thermoanaerobaculia bacterium]
PVVFRSRPLVPGSLMLIMASLKILCLSSLIRTSLRVPTPERFLSYLRVLRVMKTAVVADSHKDVGSACYD